MLPYQGTRPGWTAAAVVVLFCFFVFLAVKDARPDLMIAFKRWVLHLLGLG